MNSGYCFFIFRLFCKNDYFFFEKCFFSMNVVGCFDEIFVQYFVMDYMIVVYDCKIINKYFYLRKINSINNIKKDIGCVDIYKVVYVDFG